MASKKRKKKKGRNKVILLVFEILLLLILLFGYWLWNETFGKVTYGEKLDTTEAGINEDIDTENLEVQTGYTNVVLFGIDNRSTGNYGTGNADTMMVASLNNETKEVRIISIYRDTYLSLQDGSFHKANAAYARGGVKGAMNMINTNLDLAITDYVCVDWAALVEAIDALGGVDIEITEGEMRGINQYLHDVDEVTGQSTPLVSQYGKIHLTGSQATTYARLRKGLGEDFKRASRQRIVLQAMLTSAKNADIGKLTAACTAVFSHIETSFTSTEILSLAADVAKYEIAETAGFPFKPVGGINTNDGDTVVAAELDNNVEELHKFLFSDEEYVLSGTVQTISDNITYKTGVSEATATIDTSEFSDTAGKTGTENNNASNLQNSQ